MKKLFLTMLLLMVAVPAAHADDGAPGVGLASIEVTDPVGNGTMSGFVFYPTAQPVAGPARIGLHRIDATPDAPTLPGPRPLVVISHGQGGDAFGHHDLATHLARNGFIVASLTHPRDNHRDSSGTGTAEVLFGRPVQIKALISALFADPKWHPLVDADRVGMAGFSDGGYTGLMLLGAKPRFERYIGYCERQPQDSDTCGFIERLGADGGEGAQGFRGYAAKLETERTRWGETADPRIGAAFLMAPSSVMFDRDGVDTIEMPVFLYYGTDDRRLLPSEHVLHLAPLLRSPPEIRAVADADHWVFLAPCAAELAEAAPMICTDPPGVDRVAVHSRVNADAVTFFRQALGVDGR